MGTPFSQCAALPFARRADSACVRDGTRRARAARACAALRCRCRAAARSSRAVSAARLSRASTLLCAWRRSLKPISRPPFFPRASPLRPSALRSSLPAWRRPWRRAWRPPWCPASSRSSSSSLSAPARLRLFSLSDLKSVSYQPEPLSRNTGADMSFLSPFLPQFGHFLSGFSLIFCSTSSR